MSLLYVYSSDEQPQYAQVVLDAIAAPTGLTVTFRYHSQWVDPVTQTKWDSLRGERALIHFSLQQPARYHSAVIFPVRTASVVRADREGDIFLLDLAVDELVTYRQPSNMVRPDWSERHSQYRELLDRLHVLTPYEVGVTWGGQNVLDQYAPFLDQGNAHPPPNHGSNSVHRLNLIMQYLSRTHTFKDARFLQVLRLIASTEPLDEVPFDPASQCYHLKPAANYELQVLQYQPELISATSTFSLSIDSSIVRILGEPFLRVSAEYDRLRVGLCTTDAPNARERRTVLSIKPDAGVTGPEIRLPMHIQTPAGRTVATAAATGAALVALGLPGLLTEIPTAARASILFFGAAGATWLSVVGLSRKNP